MQIKKSELLALIKEAVTDMMGQSLPAGLEEAFRAKDYEAAAKAIWDASDKRLYKAAAYLDDLPSQIIKDLTGERSTGLVRDEVYSRLYDISVATAQFELNASPHKAELIALADALDITVIPTADVKRLQFQVRMKGGVPSSIILNGEGGSGYGRYVVSDRHTGQAKTTIARIVDALKALGAKPVARGMGPGRPKPATGYDGWAW